MRKVTVRLPDELKTQLEAVLKERGVPQQEFCLVAIEEKIAAHEARIGIERAAKAMEEEENFNHCVVEVKDASKFGEVTHTK